MPSYRPLVRIPLALLLLAVLCCPWATVYAQSGSPPPNCYPIPEKGYRVEPLNATFPRNLVLNSGLLASNRSEICDFTNINDGLGLSISYFFEEALCSVYVRENTKVLDAQDTQRAMNNEISGVIGDMKEIVSRGMYSEIAPDDQTSTLKIHGHDFVVQGVLVSRPDHTQSKSYIVVGVIRKSIVKLRITMRSDFNNISDDFLSAFTSSLGKILPR